MNAKEEYAKSYRYVRHDNWGRLMVSFGHGTEISEKALASYRMATAKNPMTFKQFIDCLEAAQCGLAYATRRHWFFVVDGQELQFTKSECARFARYFSEGFTLDYSDYRKIVKSGGCYINARLFEDDEVFPLKAKVIGYARFVIGCKGSGVPCAWVGNHKIAIIKANSRHIPTQADYDAEQSDMQAEMEMQRYG